MSSSLDNSWQPLDIGAGGYLTGIDIAPDDTMVVRTDTYGAYIWNGTEWQQVVTSTSMPAATVATGSPQGVYEIQIAPSDTNILYMEYSGNVYRSDNKGETWTQTAFSTVTESPNDVYRMDGQKMAVDPNNPDVVYVGTPQNGLFVTTDGGASWQNVGAIPVSTKDSNGIYQGITGIVFDPTSGTTGGKTNIIYASSAGNGVFESINGGVSWSALAGGPKDVESATVSSIGVYYAVGDNNTDVWRYSNGTWTELLSVTSNPNGFHTVTVDPFNPNHIIVATSGGSLNQSFDGGATWSGQNWNTQFSATDVPWLATTGQYMSIGGMVFDQLVPNKIWASDGVGIWDTTVPTKLLWNTPVVWDSQSAGIEQLVANEILVPPGGTPILASWDRAFIDVTDPNTFPSTYGPVNGKFSAGWSLDYASSDPKFIVGIADWWGVEQSGYSTDGGQTWNLFPTMPSFAGKAIGGTIAASSPTDIVWAPADGYAPVYTLDGGETWHTVVLPGVTDWSQFDFAYYLDKQTVTADRVLPNTFYLYYNGVYKSTDGGATWTEVYNKPISAFSDFNSKIEAVPGEAGNLFFTGGPQGVATHPAGEQFYQSADGGASWTAVPNVLEVKTFGFGAPATAGGYPSIYIVGWVNQVYGIWQSNDDAKSWTQIGDYPDGILSTIKTISGDPNTYGEVYVGFNGAGYAYLPAAPVGPAAPTITSFSPDTGTVGDGITNANHLTLTGSAVAGSTVEVFDGSTQIGTATANSDGAWSFAIGTLIDGSHAFTAKDVDTAGNVSAASAALNVTIDTVAPAAPTVVSFSPDSGPVGDGITNVNHLTVTGTAVAGSTVEVFDGATEIGTAAANGSGAWSFATGTLADGSHAITAEDVDVAGNVSAASAPLNVTIDTVAPAAPTVASFSPDGVTVGDGITNVNHLTLTGTAVADSTVEVFDGTTEIGTATVNSSGAWSFATGTLADGPHAFTAEDVDVAGNVSAASTALNVTVDTIAPAAPVLIADTNVTPTTLLITGTAEAGTTVRLYDGSTLLGTVLAGSSGNWSITTSPLSNGSHDFTATATDAAGNVSLISDALDPVINAVAAPVVVSFSPDSNVVGDGITNVNHITLTGTAAANSKVEIFDGATQIGTVTANASGNWSFATKTLTSGTHAFTAKDVNAAGNVSAASAALNVTIDTTAPGKPTVVGFSPDTNVVGDGITDANHITLAGTAEANSTVEVFDGTKEIGTAIANSSGAWSFATGTLASGAHSFTTKAMDAAGNVGAASTALKVTVDTSAPAAPHVVSDAVSGNSLTVKGTAEANSLVSVYDGTTFLGTAHASTSGTWSFTTGALSLGSHELAATSTDVAGNVSNMSSALDATINPTDIHAGAKLELTGASSQAVKFDGSTGTLVLDHSMTFTGQIFNLSGNGSLSRSDQIDLKDIAFSSGTVETYTGNTFGGTLTITDAQHHTASLALVGDYTHSTFSLSSDGHGGTIVIDPPADNFSFVSGTPPVGTPPFQSMALGRVENDGFVFHQFTSANAGGSDSFAHDESLPTVGNNTSHALGVPVQLDQWTAGIQDADFVHPNDAAIHFAGLHAGNFMIH